MIHDFCETRNTSRGGIAGEGEGPLAQFAYDSLLVA
jgi:hypothetical protein